MFNFIVTVGTLREFQFVLRKDKKQNCCHANGTTGIILLLFWLSLMVPSLKNSPQIFLEKSLNQYLTDLKSQPDDDIILLICIIQKH